jgi:hypothetical protein
LTISVIGSKAKEFDFVFLAGNNVERGASWGNILAQIPHNNAQKNFSNQEA